MKIKIPTTCPCCNYQLELVNDQLFCRNQACSAQLGKRVEHFCKTLGIKGMGAKTIEKLELADITEIYYLTEESIASALGSERLAEKLVDEINRSKQASLDQVLASFSIPLLGNTAAKKLCQVIESIDDVNTETCKQAGLGDKVTQNLITWLNTDFQEIREFLPFSFETTKKSVLNTNSSKTICITGRLKNYKTKSEAYRLLESLGFEITESVTKSTNYLVDEEDRGSSKRKRAEELNITIITNLPQFLKEITND